MIINKVYFKTEVIKSVAWHLYVTISKATKQAFRKNTNDPQLTQTCENQYLATNFLTNSDYSSKCIITTSGSRCVFNYQIIVSKEEKLV